MLVTHDRGEAQALGDRVAVMHGAGGSSRWTRRARFRAPVSEEVARFVGVETLLECRVQSVADGLAILEAGKQTIEVAQPAEAGEWVRLCVRPEDVTLTTRAGGSMSSARNHLEGQIVRLAQSGPHVRVTIDCGFPLVALVTQRSVTEMGLGPRQPGDRPLQGHRGASAPPRQALTARKSPGV